MELERYRIYSEIARGIRKPFLVFKNANVFMAHSGEFCKGDVAVEDGIVIGVGEYEGETEIDLDGKYLCPGFIDSHLHLESTLLLSLWILMNPQMSQELTESTISWNRRKRFRQMSM